jgi:hypothetical protein
VRFNAARNCSRQKSGDKRESFFSNMPPPATLIFTRAALFIAQEQHEHQQKQRFFLFCGVLLPSAADFFQSECVCNRLRTTDAPVADPSFFSKSECENHFLRQRELMKKWKIGADFTLRGEVDWIFYEAAGGALLRIN